MWQHFVSFLLRILHGMPLLVSSNWAAWGLGLLAFVVTEAMLFVTTPKESRSKRLKSNVLIGVGVTLFVYSTLFVWSTIQTTYDDHRDVDTRWKSLVREKDGLKQELSSRDGYIKQLQARPYCSQRAAKDGRSEVRQAPPLASIQPTPQSNLTTAPYQYRTEMTLKQSAVLVERLANVFKRYQPIWFVVTAPTESKSFKDDLYDAIVSACHQAGPNSCTIEPAPDPEKEVDTGIPESKYNGVVIHSVSKQPDEYLGEAIFGAFSTVSHSQEWEFPDAINKLNMIHNPNFVWIQIGRENPWTHSCGQY